MVVKSAIIAGTLATISAVPLAVPAFTGTPVELAIGPFEARFEQHLRVDFGVRGECLARDCTFMELGIGDEIRLTL